MPLTSIFHVNVNCSDLDVSLPFYENLGFQTVINLPTGGDDELVARFVPAVVIPALREKIPQRQ